MNFFVPFQERLLLLLLVDASGDYSQESRDIGFLFATRKLLPDKEKENVTKFLENSPLFPRR